MQAFSSSQSAQANQHLVRYAQQRFPSEFKQNEDPRLLQFVEKVRATAGRYGIEKENDVATFLDFTVMFGLDFPKSAWAEDILNCDTLYGPDKMAVLRHRVSETGTKL